MAGPDYKKPAVPTPAAYRGVSPEPRVKPDVASFGDQKWWDAFQDDVLRDLIRSALQQNYDVRIAAARILEARALLGITSADQLPEVSAAASVVNQRSLRLPGDPPLRRARHRSASRPHGSWISGANSDAPPNRLAPASSRKSGHSVKSSVRSSAMWRAAYFQLREQDLELEISRQTLASRTRLAAPDTTPCGPRRHVPARRATG